MENDGSNIYLTGCFQSVLDCNPVGSETHNLSAESPHYLLAVDEEEGVSTRPVEWFDVLAGPVDSNYSVDTDPVAGNRRRL